MKVKKLIFPKALSAFVETHIDQNLASHNPYLCSKDVAENSARQVWRVLSSHEPSDRDERESLHDLIDIIRRAQKGDNIPPFLLKGFANEPPGSFVRPHDTRGFRYADNEKDRMKVFFTTEWASWILAILLNHENRVHPSEHGGGNRFHLVSPISISDKSLRKVGASTGGGKFHQHNDATVHNSFRTREDLIEALRSFRTSLEIVEKEIGTSKDELVKQSLCGKFIRVDATMLSGVFNKNTLTHVLTPQKLQEYLQESGYSSQDLASLAKMPVAHIAGPSDGEISGHFGTVASPIELDENHEIASTCVNFAENRMIYVGDDNEHKRLFNRFLEDVRCGPVEEILIEPSDILFCPNSAYGAQQNVSHGRAELSDDEYSIEVEPGVFVRRMHCRQYLASRQRENMPPFLNL